MNDAVPSPRPDIATLFPPGVATLEATRGMWESPLHPAEEAFVAGAVAKRRREFAAGRACARGALERLGLVGHAVLAREDRSPLWPEGVVGSISHCTSHCAASVALETQIAMIGLDLEEDTPLPEELVTSVCTGTEYRRLEGFPREAGANWSKLVFSAKECFYKAYYPATRTFLDFHDVEITLDPSRNLFVGSLLNEDAPPAWNQRSLRGRFARGGGVLVTAIAVSRADLDHSSAPLAASSA